MMGPQKPSDSGWKIIEGVRTEVMCSSLLPTEGCVFGKERMIWGLTTKDGIEEKTLVSWTVACGTRTKGPG